MPGATGRPGRLGALAGSWYGAAWPTIPSITTRDADRVMMLCVQLAPLAADPLDTEREPAPLEAEERDPYTLCEGRS